MSEGKSFHKFGAAHPNERSPRVGNVLRVVFWSKSFEFDLILYDDGG